MFLYINVWASYKTKGPKGALLQRLKNWAVGILANKDRAKWWDQSPIKLIPSGPSIVMLCILSKQQDWAACFLPTVIFR